MNGPSKRRSQATNDNSAILHQRVITNCTGIYRNVLVCHLQSTDSRQRVISRACETLLGRVAGSKVVGWSANVLPFLVTCAAYLISASWLPRIELATRTGRSDFGFRPCEGAHQRAYPLPTRRRNFNVLPISGCILVESTRRLSVDVLHALDHMR